MSRAHRPTVRRCAVYTRKSSDEGLEQSFNSLDAQREACEAYIASQKHEGWVLVPKAYDDGGLSSGSMNRPALKELLVDIGTRRVDVVVVYKVDRLTRSLADFAKLTDLLDACDASFVSVTQAFNTSTSMGRLTLNVLLSFAQFEREVAGERIRDKIAASKKRGMWMGGLPPLGYDIQEKQLVANEADAKTIQTIFEAYVRLGTVAKLKATMDTAGVVSKKRIAKIKINGVETGTVSELGGKPISRSGYQATLKCHTYRGKIHHKGQVYQGNHKAIISEELWEAVQAQITSNTADHGLSRIGQKCERVREVRKLTGNHMLTGILFDTKGERLSPSHATKRTKDGGTRRYFYYVVASLVRGQATSKGIRVSAPDLDSLVVITLKGHLTNQDLLAGQLKESQYIGDHGDTRNQGSGGQHENDRRSSNRGGSNQGDRDQNHVGHEQELRKPPTGVQHLHRAFEAGQAIANTITRMTTRALLERVVLDQGSITISIHGRALHEAL